MAPTEVEEEGGLWEQEPWEHLKLTPGDLSEKAKSSWAEMQLFSLTQCLAHTRCSINIYWMNKLMKPSN